MSELKSRRDQIDVVKTVFLIIKLVSMVAVAVVATLQLLYTHYAEPLIEKGRPEEITAEGFWLYLEDPANTLLAASYSICSFIAFAFVTFLVFHGIQTIIIRAMQRSY